MVCGNGKRGRESPEKYEVENRETMRKMKALANILSFTFILFLPAVGLSQTTTAKIEDLGWIAGCWESSDKGVLISEQWMKPAGGMMMGMGRTVKSGKTTTFEFVRIVQDASGIAYVAKPAENATETPFKLVKWSAAEAIFENVEHDFPQRVIYRRSGDKLLPRIEGTVGGKLKGIDFPMTRVDCN